MQHSAAQNGRYGPDKPNLPGLAAIRSPIGQPHSVIVLGAPRPSPQKRIDSRLVGTQLHDPGAGDHAAFPEIEMTFAKVYSMAWNDGPQDEG